MSTTPRASSSAPTWRAMERATARGSEPVSEERMARPPTSTVQVDAGPGLTFDGVPFTMNYTAAAGVIQVNYGGDAGHTLVFTDPKLNGFELETSKNKTGNVELKAGKYTFYCNVTGHRAAGMQATLTVS